MIIAAFWDTLQGILDAILNLIGQLIFWIDEAIILFVNLIIVGLGTLISTVIALLPGMPSRDGWPDWITTGMQWASYWFPMPFFLTTITTVATLWIAWLVIRIPLRWGKANPE